MKKSITKCQFHDEFKAYNRQDNFSYDGLNALYDYLEQYEEDTGCDVELDVIAICCEYTEYDSADEAASEYFEYEGMEFDDNGEEMLSPEEVEKKAIDFLQERTSIILFDSGIIIQDF